MATKGAKKNDGWKGFANIQFNADARQTYQTWEPGADAVYREMAESIGAGYRFTFSYDKTNDAYQCSVTCANDRDANNGWTLTSRGPSWFDALMVAVFKMTVLCPGEWPKSDKTAGDKWG